MSEANELVHEFLVESYENLDQVDRDLVALETDPKDRARLAGVFRAIHTVKGTCGFFGFAKLESVAHVGENLLSLLRDGAMQLQPHIATVLLRLVDAVREMLGQIESTGAEGDADYQDLIEHLTRLQAPPTEQTPFPAAPAPTAAAPAAADRPLPMSASNIRVDVGLLDRLMTLVGELVLARNQILQFNGTQKDPAFLNTTQRLNLITSELQEGVMKTRMQPIGNIWGRLPRVVRDLATACGKKVRVEMDGKDTELDRTIIEAIKDPLTHVVRNSVDHGIEAPEVRLQRGKPAEGCLSLRAFHQGGQVIIEIADDGSGIDAERVKQKALERGLITPEQASRLTERDMIALLFLPGFSTAQTITNVSGRGVGMDVVKTNIEKINGTIDLQTKPGAGTTLRITIPLTLAIIPALIVGSGGERYAIPQVSLIELVHLDSDKPDGGIERVHGAPVYRLRGRLLPLVHLDDILGTARPAPADADSTTARPSLNLVVLQAEQRQFGVVVDRIYDTEEIVVKPLSQLLRGIALYAGATIMGDGRVALILDVSGIARHADLTFDAREHKLVDGTAEAQRTDRHSCLVVYAGKDRRLAIPLAQVARLEEVAAKDFERADEQQVLQYRGRILPLLHVGTRVFGDAPDPPAETMPLVVCTDSDRSVGLLVERIVDIVETPLDQWRRTRRPGLLGSAVINSQVMDIMDVAGLLETLTV